MRVGELIETLEEMDGDAEVRLAFQPSWPLQYSIGEVFDGGVGDCDDDGYCDHAHFDEDGECVDCGADKKDAAREIRERSEKRERLQNVVWIAEAGQVTDEPYLPGFVSTGLGWR